VMGVLQIVSNAMLIANNVWKQLQLESFAIVSSSGVAKDLRLYEYECYGIAKA